MERETMDYRKGKNHLKKLDGSWVSAGNGMENENHEIEQSSMTDSIEE